MPDATATSLPERQYRRRFAPKRGPLFGRGESSSAVASYGEDPWTARVAEQVREIFETDCETFFVFNGTAANSLALAQLCRPFHSVLCHERAHIETDECGGPEFFSGGAKLLRSARKRQARPRRSRGSARRDIATCTRRNARAQRSLRRPSAGRSTRLDELDAIAAFREARALLCIWTARVSRTPWPRSAAAAEITWQRGVDVLSLSAARKTAPRPASWSFFSISDLAREFDYRAKQAGQLASKMRFLAAPWAGCSANDVWLKNARHANDMARLLEKKLRAAGLTGFRSSPRSERALPASARRNRGANARAWLAFLQIHRARYLSADVFLVDDDEEIDDFVDSGLPAASECVDADVNARTRDLPILRTRETRSSRSLARSRGSFSRRRPARENPPRCRKSCSITDCSAMAKSSSCNRAASPRASSPAASLLNARSARRRSRLSDSLRENGLEKTRIRFVTEGILLRQLLQDPELRGVAAILFDEFHERHLYGDITLARALQLQETSTPRSQAGRHVRHARVRQAREISRALPGRSPRAAECIRSRSNT